MNAPKNKERGQNKLNKSETSVNHFYQNNNVFVHFYIIIFPFAVEILKQRIYKNVKPQRQWCRRKTSTGAISSGNQQQYRSSCQIPALILTVLCPWLCVHIYCSLTKVHILFCKVSVPKLVTCIHAYIHTKQIIELGCPR